MCNVKAIGREARKTLQEFRALYSSPARFARFNMRQGVKLLLGYPRVGATFAALCFMLGGFVLIFFDRLHGSPQMEEKKYFLTGFMWICSALLLAVSIKGFSKRDS